MSPCVACTGRQELLDRFCAAAEAALDAAPSLMFDEDVIVTVRDTACTWVSVRGGIQMWIQDQCARCIIVEGVTEAIAALFGGA